MRKVSSETEVTTQPAAGGGVAEQTGHDGCSRPHIRILRLPEVISRVGLQRASIYLHIARGSFPRQIPLGPRAVGWIEHEIDAWLVEQISARHVRPDDIEDQLAHTVQDSNGRAYNRTTHLPERRKMMQDRAD